MDNEIKGEGNSVNYKYRMHDPRVGRFFAVDPLIKEYPHYSPYSFGGNKVIHKNELEGLEETNLIIYNNLQDATTFVKAMNKGDIGAALLEANRAIRDGSADQHKWKNVIDDDVLQISYFNDTFEATSLFRATSKHPNLLQKGFNSLGFNSLTSLVGEDVNGITFKGGINFADGGNSISGIAGSSRRGQGMTIDFGGGLTAIMAALGPGNTRTIGGEASVELVGVLEVLTKELEEVGVLEKGVSDFSSNKGNNLIVRKYISGSSKAHDNKTSITFDKNDTLIRNTQENIKAVDKLSEKNKDQKADSITKKKYGL